MLTGRPKQGKTLPEGLFFSQKNSEKVLDKGGRVWYISQARLREIIPGRAKRTLKTIQREKRANKGTVQRCTEKTAKIPKSLASKDVKD